LHTGTAFAITRGHATKLMSSDNETTDRPSKRVPRDTLCLLLLETPQIRNLGLNYPPPNRLLWRFTKGLIYPSRAAITDMARQRLLYHALFSPRFIPFPCLLHKCGFCPWAFDLQPSCIHSPLDLTYHHRADSTYLHHAALKTRPVHNCDLSSHLEPFRISS
jgi:hypothetical protein